MFWELWILYTYIANIFTVHNGYWYEHIIIHHRCLQSCVGTQARLGYAAFDAQLQKAYFVTTLYAIRTSVSA